MIRRLALTGCLAIGLGLLAACDSAEERAQEHFEKGMALLQEGDVDRALVEFRNVFQLNGYHKDARLAYARVEEERGNVPEAYSQYLRLVEQYPEDLDGQRALARLATEIGKWDEAERHATAAAALAPTDPVIRGVQASLAYRQARMDNDPKAAEAAVHKAQALLKDEPGLNSARRVVIDDLLTRQAWPEALEAVDAALEDTPNDRRIWQIRLGVLEQLGRDDEIESQLKEMIERFPEDEQVQGMLLRWYISRNRTEAAEEYLRKRVEPDAEDPSAQVELLQFLARMEGPEAAREEADRVLEESGTEGANAELFRSIRAGLDFDLGNRDAAIAEMEEILEQAGSSEQTDRIKVALARMRIATGNAVGARALVEEVLEHDPSQVEALKLKASWLIDDDRTGDALIDLRQALDQSPNDPGIMSLMARAHERAGNRELMAEMLGLAAEASNNAPEEALRYARYLIQEKKYLPAEDVLKASLRLQSTDLTLLKTLGELYVQMEDWARLQGVIDRLEGLEDPAAKNAARELTARQLAGQQNEEELRSFLGSIAEGQGGLQGLASRIRLRIAEGDLEGALQMVRAEIETSPEEPRLRFIEGTILARDGKTEEAREIFRDLAGKYPKNDRVWMALYNLRRSEGDPEGASKVLDEALEAAPDSNALRWGKAGELERSGDIDGAIAIYEDLYKANSDSAVLANNLASLISSYREDDESLERAYRVARRLRGTDVPAFQDTYGWITFRLGNLQEALDYLEPAAKGLPQDPIVQYHLARAYVGVDRPKEALESFRRSAAIVAERSGARPPYMDEVESEIARLEAANSGDEAESGTGDEETETGTNSGNND